jgi:hypothetical protein
MEAQATATVKEALAALYHHPDDTIRTAADRWLQKFQHTLDAWQVRAGALLGSIRSMSPPCSFASRGDFRRAIGCRGGGFWECLYGFRPDWRKISAILEWSADFSRGGDALRLDLFGAAFSAALVADHFNGFQFGGTGGTPNVELV